MSKFSVQLINVSGCVDDVGMESLGFGWANKSCSISMIQTMNIRNGADDFSVLASAMDDTSSIFDEDRASSMIQARYRNKGECHFWCAIDIFQNGC